MSTPGMVPLGKPGPGSGQLQSLRMLAGAMTMAALIVTAVMWFVMGSSPGPSSWSVIGGLVGLVAIASLIAPGLTRLVTPLDAGSPVDEQVALSRYRANMMITLAVCELPLLVGLAVAWVVQPMTPVHLLPGGLGTAVLIRLYVFPNRTTIDRVEQRLNSHGAQSNLAQSLGG